MDHVKSAVMWSTIIRNYEPPVVPAAHPLKVFLRCSIQHNFIGKLSNFDLQVVFATSISSKIYPHSFLLFGEKRRPKKKHLRQKNCCERISNTLRACHSKTHDRSHRLNLKLQGARIWVLLVHPNVGIVEDHLAALKHWKTDGPNQQKPSIEFKKITVLNTCLTTDPKLHGTWKQKQFSFEIHCSTCSVLLVREKSQKSSFKGQFNLPFFIVHPTASTERYGNIWWESPWTCWIRILLGKNPPAINLWDNKSASPRICCTRKIPIISSKGLAAKGFLEDFCICGSSDASYWRRILWGQPSH